MRLYSIFRTLLGLALILAGGYVIFQVLIEVRALYSDPEKVKLFLTLVPQDEKLREMTMNDQKIILPLAAFHFAAYAVSYFLLFLAGLLGAMLMGRGVSVMDFDIILSDERR